MKDFDKDFDRMGKQIKVVFAVNILLIAGGIWFVVWVVLKLLAFFGVI